MDQVKQKKTPKEKYLEPVQNSTMIHKTANRSYAVDDNQVTEILL
jgi:hypothetical protein